MISFKMWGALVAVGIMVPACSSSSSGTSAGGSTDQEVSECKSGCDQAKFFQCSDTAGLSKCYDDCNSASPAQVDKFNGCSQTAICDPSCRSLIDPPPASGGSGSTQSGGGVDQSDCQSACTKLITTCSFAPVSEMSDCLSQCQASGYQYQIDCVNNNACTDIQTRCGNTGSSGGGGGGGGGTLDAGGGTDPDVPRCQNDCTLLHQQSCLTSDELSTCNNDCNTAGSARTNFESCAESADPTDCSAEHDCYATFSGG